MMADTTATDTSAGTETLARPSPSRPVMIDALRAEWIKLRSVRSTYWTLGLAVVAMVGMGALFAPRFTHLTPAEQASINPASYSLSGFFLAQLALGVLGVLVMASEYSTGSIRASLTALPQRPTLLAAKAIVLMIVTVPVAMASSFAAFFAGQAILSTSTTSARLGDPGVARAVVGAGLYLTALAVGSLALRALIRRARWSARPGRGPVVGG
jgi:ABC-type transport system involved in multi-copper enzyme maturation permease subunit